MAEAGVELIAVDELGGSGVEAAVTTRGGGCSIPPYDRLNLGLHVGDEDARVVANREEVARAFGCQLDDMVFLDQIHGSRVAVVDASHAGRGARHLDNALSATDAAVTTTIGLPIVVQVADCSPIVLVDEVAGVLGLAHAGWRGALGGVAQATVGAMERLGAEPGRLRAWIGPSVDPARYEVGDEVASAAEAAGAGAAVIALGGSLHLDLPLANAIVLEGLGLHPERILRSDLTTEDPRLFSDRRARPCGRFAVLARLTGAAVASRAR